MASIFAGMPPIVEPAHYANELWSEQHEKYQEWAKYFTGDVLREVIETADGESEPRFPLRINLCKTIVKLNAYAVLGEWDDHVFTWKSALPDGGDERQLDYLHKLGVLSGINSLYVRQILTHRALGGMVWRISTSADRGLRWSALPPEHFYPIFSTLDDDLIELFVVFNISAREAVLRYNISEPSGDSVIYMEHWTPSGVEKTVDGQVVGKNPLIDGVIPYVYIPGANMVGERYGVSVIEDVMGLQDELNLRLADMGDAIKRETHKDIVVSNLPGGVRGIRRDSGILDLGMGLGNSKPTVHQYNRADLPSGSFDFVSSVVDFSRYSGDTPPVAYGVDEGSQRSGMTLSFRMWPLIHNGRTQRAFIADGMRQLANKTLRLAKSAHVVDGSLGEYTINMPPMLPKDREQAVNEVVQLTGAEKISDERAVDLLDVPEDKQDEELNRIRVLREEARQFAQKQAQSQTGEQAIND